MAGLVAKRNFCRRIGGQIALVLLVAFQPTSAIAQVTEAEAPPNHRILSTTSTGVYFAPSELLNEKDRMAQDLEGLSEKASAERRQELQNRMDEISKDIEKAKVLVEPFRVSTKREIQLFDLSPSRQLIVNADEVILRGWNGDSIRCVLEKTVLSKEGDGSEDLATIQIDHAVRIAEDLIGITDEQFAKSFSEYEASLTEQELTEDQRNSRLETMKSNRALKLIYGPLHGQRVNVLQMKGLKEGNGMHAAKIASKGGEALHSSFWKRAAKLTIYVPKCKTIALRGCMKRVDIKSVESDLILTNEDSQDRDYDGSFEIVNIKGSVRSRQVPLQKVSDVQGDVEVTRTVEYANIRTLHSGKGRRTESPPSKQLILEKIAGDLRGKFVRTQVVIADTPTGTIDLENEYGDTHLQLSEPLAAAAHRIISHSGGITLTVINEKQLGASLFAYTQVGAVESRLKDAESFHFSSSRTWYGYHLVKDGPRQGWGFMFRPEPAWSGKSRAEGLDLMSASGVIVLQKILE